MITIKVDRKTILRADTSVQVYGRNEDAVKLCLEWLVSRIHKSQIAVPHKQLLSDGTRAQAYAIFEAGIFSGSEDGIPDLKQIGIIYGVREPHLEMLQLEGDRRDLLLEAMYYGNNCNEVFLRMAQPAISRLYKVK